jgi:hypothetical protein
VKFYRAAPLNTTPAGQGDPAEPGGAVIAIRLADLVSPAGPAAKAGTGRRWRPAHDTTGAARHWSSAAALPCLGRYVRRLLAGNSFRARKASSASPGVS